MNSRPPTQRNLKAPLKPIVLNVSPPKTKLKPVTVSRKEKKNTSNFVISKSLLRWGPINFEEFVGILKNYKLLLKEGADLERAGTRPSPKFGTITQNHIYEDGVSKLLRVSFLSEEDATTSIKIVIQRAFGQFSAVVKNRKKGKDKKLVSVGYDCTKAIHKKGDKTKVDKCEKCHWKAVLKSMDDGSFQFNSIGTLDTHVHKCFEGLSNSSVGLLEHLSKLLCDCGKDLMDFEMFNETFHRKTNYAVPKKWVDRHIYYKKRKAGQNTDDEFIDICGSSGENSNDLRPEDEALIDPSFPSNEDIEEFENGCVNSGEGKLIEACKIPKEEPIYDIKEPPEKIPCTFIGQVPPTIYESGVVVKEEKTYP